jgi:transposase-like protein
MNAKAEVLKQDVRGRVRVSAERREALLDEFERSGASGAKFARLAGIKYATFANWVMKRRRERGRAGTGVHAAGSGVDVVTKAGAVRLLEAVVDGCGRTEQTAACAQGLLIELPGGSRMLVGSPVQLQLAAELVALVAKNARVRC